MDLQAIRSLIAEDLQAVDRLIHARLRSEVALINQLGNYIVNSGGKRLRPLLVVLSAHACGYPGRDHVEMATVVEFIHTATLLHDDVVDDSALRRGRETANALWGNEASVLVGDFLYSRAFEMMVEVRDMRVMELMAHTTNAIAEGEVMQLLNCHDAETSEAEYLEVIRRKTAKLFEAGARLGAILAGRAEVDQQAMAVYGMHLGTAFQLVDDVLDYSADPDETGKNIGDDLAEGKPTLPLIYAMQRGSAGQARAVRAAIEDDGRAAIGAVLEAIESTGAIAYTQALATEQADRAKAAIRALPAGPYKEALDALATFAIERSY